MAGAAAGLMSTAGFTTLMVVSSQALGLASFTSCAALAGSSAAGTLVKIFLNDFEASFASELNALKPITLNVMIAICLIINPPQLPGHGRLNSCLHISNK